MDCEHSRGAAMDIFVRILLFIPTSHALAQKNVIIMSMQMPPKSCLKAIHLPPLPHH
jgi:hypothetical protein